MEIEKTYKKGNKELRVIREESPESPREWDNVGTMVCFHNRYNLGDKTNLNQDSFNSWEELKEYLVEELKAEVILPLRLYDHSGISISCGTEYPFNDRWDSGCVGFIYVTKDKLNEEGINKEDAEKRLKGEVETYDQYLNGDIYGFQLVELTNCKCCSHNGEVELDSCWGFYGDNPFENGMSDNVNIKNFKEVEQE